jgi:hypothetical protein
MSRIISNQRIEGSRSTISRKKRNQQKEAQSAKGKQAQQSDLPCFCFLCSYLACCFFSSFCSFIPLRVRIEHEPPLLSSSISRASTDLAGILCSVIICVAYLHRMMRDENYRHGTQAFRPFQPRGDPVRQFARLVHIAGS